VNVEVNNAPWKVVEFMHVKPGKGSAFVRSKLKNYLTKSTNEITFRAGEKLQTADVEKRTMQYTYKDGEQFVFMDMETYEETRVSALRTSQTHCYLRFMEYSRKARYHYRTTQSLIHVTKYTHTRQLATDPFLFTFSGG
jgi:translation elongation factor P/translation initiation factor 5A|tara:strand:+ start:618 stop:1034 length:417 start_codon:yes stop_codon:yes gene_type:complete